MWMRRPEWLIESLHNVEEPTKEYLCHNTDMFVPGDDWNIDYRYISDGSEGEDNIVSALGLARESKKTITRGDIPRALDLGCGAAGLVIRLIKDGWRAQGVSRTDYTKYRDANLSLVTMSEEQEAELNALDKLTYIVGDVNFLAQNGALEPPYDLVVSQLLARWLDLDPIAWLESSLNMVGENGIYATDMFFFCCGTASVKHSRLKRQLFTMRDVWSAVTKGGFVAYNEDFVPGHLGAQSCPDLALRRTDARIPVRFNAGYQRGVLGETVYIKL